MSEQLSKFEQRAQRLLRESAEQLDGHTRSRLTQARFAAVAALKTPRMPIWKWATPAMGATAAAVVAVTMMWTTGPITRPSTELAKISSAEELEIMTSEDSLEFYRDMDFYVWLGALDDADAPAQPVAGKSGV